MSLINKIAVQAYRTFLRGGCGESEQSFHQNLSLLRDLVSRLSCHDVNFDASLVGYASRFDPDCGLAPVTFIDLWKDDHFSMSIFVLKPGTRLPLHDHPGMYGVIRVLHGHVSVFSYSLLERKCGDAFQPLADYGESYSVNKGDVFTSQRISSLSVDINSEPIVLTPTDGNIHEIRATDSAAAFFDILAPPYDEHRYGHHRCHYYKEIPVSESSTEPFSSSHERKLCSLLCIPAPLDYWTDYAPYVGPAIDPYQTL